MSAWESQTFGVLYGFGGGGGSCDGKTLNTRIANLDYLCRYFNIDLTERGTHSALLDSKLLDQYASSIDINKAKIYNISDFPDHPDTIYLTVRDKDGMLISFINSLFDAFGSGITAPKSGVLFHCRGKGFNTIPGHPNELNPEKRPLHTIIPAMISKDDRLIGSFGVMGGQYQAAGHAYVLSQMIDFGLNPQLALNYPRVFPNNNKLDIEDDFDTDLINELISKGHQINYPVPPIGGGQMILIDEEKSILIGASDWRKDGLAIGY